jgi:hypothetical protein
MNPLFAPMYGATSGRFAAFGAISGGSEQATSKAAAAKHKPRVLKLDFISLLLGFLQQELGLALEHLVHRMR